MLVFYTDHLFGLNMARNALQGFLGGQMIPLAYMGALGVAFSFTPFAFMNSVPVLTIMGKLDINSILIYLGIAIIWIFIIELINHLIFKRAIRKITVQGG
jgi:ABC-2 type transport system permease protein